MMMKANSTNNDQTGGVRQPTMSKLNRMETMMKMMLVMGAKRRKMAAKPFKIKTNLEIYLFINISTDDRLK